MYTSRLVEKFNNAVSVYSFLVPNSSNNVEGFNNWLWTDGSETRDSICLLTPRPLLNKLFTLL